MPRSSRQKSNRADKHGPRDGWDRSDSDEDGGSRDRKQRVEEPAAGSGARVSRDPDPAKRKSSSASQPHLGNNDQISPDSGGFSAGKKRKERAEDLSATDRWVGGGEDGDTVDKRPKCEAFGPAELEKAAKPKVSPSDSKGRSTRRHEGPTERYEENGGKDESGKHRSEKDSSRRESSGQHKDVKDRDKGGGSERDKDARNHRGVKTGSSEAEGLVNKDKGNTEWRIQEELRNHELEKELEKRIRRRDDSSDKDKWQGDGRESDDRRRRESDDRRRNGSDDRRHKEKDDKKLSSRDDHTKIGSYGDERYKEERNKDGMYSRDKHQDDLDRDRRHRDDRHHEEHSRDRASDRYDGKYIKDGKTPEGDHKKSKLQNSDHDGGAYIEDHGTRFKDIRGQKRSSDGNEDHRDLKLRSTKQPRGDVEKNASDTSKLDSNMVDRARSDYRHPNKVDSSLSDNRSKSSPRSSSHAVKDQSRYSLKQADSTHRESPARERFRSNAASIDHASISGVAEKTKPKDSVNPGGLITEVAAAPQYERTPRSDGHISPIILTEKSPSTSDRRYPSRRHSLDVEDRGQISSTPKDGRDSCKIDDREYKDNQSQMDLQTSKHIAGSHLPPRPPVRPRTGSPSVLGSFEVDNRYQNGDHKPNSRYKRNDGYNSGRAQGNAWRSSPAGRPPVPNGFIPFQHGPLLPPAFPSALQQFPAPSLYGMAPMDMNSPGVSYHMQDAADRFSNHGRPYVLLNNSLDDSRPQWQGWDGSNGGAYSDGSSVYGRAEWDENSRRLMGSQGSEMSDSIWKGQNGNMNMDSPVPHDELKYTSCALKDDDAWAEESGHRSHTKRAHSECVPDERTGIKPSSDTPSAKHDVETLHTPKQEKTTTEPSKTPSDDTARACCGYLSQLDISHDLTCPELYKQYMTLMGTRDPPDVSSSSRHGSPQNVNRDTKAAAKRSNGILHSLFCKKTEDVFQRAVSLYNRQKEATERKLPVSPASSEEGKKDHPETSDTEKVNADDHQAGEEAPKADAGSTMDIEVGCDTFTDAEADVARDANERKSDDLISEAVVFVVSPTRGCEAMVPESIRVNLSRIPYSPESTH